MVTEIIVPALGESVTEATVIKWLKAKGEAVAVDEPLLELETDKVTLEVNASAAGTLDKIAAEEGAEVEVGTLLGTIAEGAVASDAEAGKEKTAPPPHASPPSPTLPTPPPALAPPTAPALTLSPAVRRLVEEHNLDPTSIPAGGKEGRLTKGDVLAAVKNTATASASPKPSQYPPRPAGPREEKVRMTRLRKRVAERLKEAQNTAAILTTFNEADMTNLIGMRNQVKEKFEKKHGVKPGFMSFFAKAAVVALREFPAVNAEISGDEVIYKNHYDLGIAVGTGQGLVVPVVRDVDALSFAEIEKAIAELAARARDGRLSVDELTGGTFTITNGGVYGSLMSTPILNPPQSGILGMHKTQMRPVVISDGSIEARPMMYIALSYDHRIVDGREAVSFLVRVKECIEDPQRIMLDV